MDTHAVRRISKEADCIEALRREMDKEDSSNESADNEGGNKETPETENQSLNETAK